jgi:RNA polymerase sigma factor (TIGR02999 family)
MSTITRLIAQWQHGDMSAEAELLKIAYPIIKEIAERQLRSSRQFTLRPTEIANDVCMKMRGNSALDSANSGQFFTLSAHMIRCFIVDHIRQANAQKRGADYEIVGLEFAQTECDGSRPLNWLALDSALIALEAQDKQYATLVELRYFMGMTIEQTADVMEISTATVGRIWRYARAFLAKALDEAEVT